MSRILGIGIATLDIINTVDGFPAEDSEFRAITQEFKRGGNVTNTLTVLSQLGHGCSWGGTTGNDPGAAIIRQDLQQHNISMEYCRIISNGHTPTSCITRNACNGSRTIVHFRDLPEYSASDFSYIPLEHYDWLHFEGRNVDELLEMLERVRRYSPDIPVSIEIEKTRPGIEALYRYGNILLFSRTYARQCGFDDAATFLQKINKQTVGQILICAWGNNGACALVDNRVYHSPAFILEHVVDTLGAGDTFNAGIIHGQLCAYSIEQTLSLACRLASIKCSQCGFAHLPGELAPEAARS